MSKSESIKVPLSPQEKSILRDVAKATGESMAAVMRRGLHQVAGEYGISPPDTQTDEPEQSVERGQSVDEGGEGSDAPTADDLRGRMEQESSEMGNDDTAEGGAHGSKSALNRFLFGSEG